VNRIERIADFPLPCYIKQFLGKDLENVLAQAEEWQGSTGNICKGYYEQKLRGRSLSILVYY
jgi:hypothetical protein